MQEPQSKVNIKPPAPSTEDQEEKTKPLNEDGEENGAKEKKKKAEEKKDKPST